VFLSGSGHISVDATTGVHVEEFSLLYILPGCAASEKGGWAGDLTGQFRNEDHCIHYEESGDLATIINGNVVPVPVDGAFCPTEDSLELEIGLSRIMGRIWATRAAWAAKLPFLDSSSINEHVNSRTRTFTICPNAGKKRLVRGDIPAKGKI
jgi:hypothetical protein